MKYRRSELFIRLLLYVIYLACHRAQEQLALINQVFQDVLKSEETRRHYDQLCRFRQVHVCTISCYIQCVCVCVCEGEYKKLLCKAWLII